MNFRFLLLAFLALCSCSKPDYKLLRQEALQAFQEERYAHSIGLLKKILKAEPENSAYILLMGKNHLDGGNPEKSITYIDKAIELDPQYAEAYAARASYRSQAGQFDASYKDIYRAIQLQPQNPQLYLQKGRIFKQAGKLDSAINSYTQALQLDPELVEGYQERGYLYIGQEAYGDAIVDLGKVEDLGKADASTYINLGYAKLQIQADTLALWDFEKAYQIAETQEYKGIALNNLGNVKMILGDVEGAWKDINAGIELNPNNAYAYRNKALILIAMKRFQEACDALHISIDLGYVKSYGTEVVELKEQYCEKK